MAPRAGHLLQAGPHDLLLARVAEGCGKAAEVEEAHAADVGDHARGEKRLIEVLQARELLGVGVADGLRGGLVAADEGGRVERGHGKAHEVRGKRRSGGVHGDERLPVLGRVAQGLERRLERGAVGTREGLGAGSFLGRELALCQQHGREGVAAHAHAALHERGHLRPRLLHVRLAPLLALRCHGASVLPWDGPWAGRASRLPGRRGRR